MRRFLGIGSLVASLVVLVSAGPAFAQDAGYPPTSAAPTSAAPPRGPERLPFASSNTLMLFLITLRYGT